MAPVGTPAWTLRAAICIDCPIRHYRVLASRSSLVRRELGRLSRLPLILVKCGEIHLLAGESEAAARLANDALKLATDQKERGNQAYAQLLLAECASRGGADSAEATRRYLDALALTTELGMRPLAAHCHAGLWRLYRRLDQSAQGETHLTSAAAMYREMGMRFWVSQLEREAAIG